MAKADKKEKVKTTMEKSKLKKLKEILIKTKRILIAYSGGCDSTFLTRIAAGILGKKNVIAVTAVSPTYPTRELKDAKKMARTMGVKHIIIKTAELENTNFKKNPFNRCYFCKKELFGRLRQIAKRYKIRYIADGSNADDRKDYRPGTLAKKQFGIISPLQRARFTKEEIRECSKRIKLPTWDKPALACLASRIPYGEKITDAKLRLIEKAEGSLKRIGLKQVRVRLYKDVARIEVPQSDIKKLNKEKVRGKIIGALKKLGFRYITLDLEGYRTGSLNEALRD